MPAWCVAHSGSAAPPSHLAGQRPSQQASPAAAESRGAGNWCLRSPRDRRVGQARASLPYPTPLSLRASGNGRFARRALQCLRFRSVCKSSGAADAFGQAGLSLGRSGQGLLCRSAGQEVAGQVSAWQEQGKQLKSLPIRARSRRLLRLGRQAWGWQTPPTVGLWQNPMANLSVKGTNCGRPQFAPYLER